MSELALNPKFRAESIEQGVRLPIHRTLRKQDFKPEADVFQIAKGKGEQTGRDAGLERVKAGPGMKRQVEALQGVEGVEHQSAFGECKGHLFHSSNTPFEGIIARTRRGAQGKIRPTYH